MATAKNKVQKSGAVEITNSCTNCGEPKPQNFYRSYNPIQNKIEKFTVCKKCMEEEYLKYLSKFNDGKLAIYYLCRKFDFFFSIGAYEGAVNHSASAGWTILASYFKQINSFRDENSVSKNGYGVCFDDSFDFIDRVIVNNVSTDTTTNTKQESNKSKTKTISKPITQTEGDLQNEKDVIRILKYDPFENENPNDRKYLFTKLIDFLDEETTSDSFKLPIVLEIVKSFNQIEKINQALASIEVSDIATNISDVKNLMQTKTTTLSSILAMAKDNGISVNHSNNKSKGAGTLSGLIKELQEKGVSASEVNLYDIETCSGMKQVADISNSSILEQLNLNENDYVDMIKDQRSLIEQLDSKSNKLEEENRLLKIKMKEIEEYLNSMKNHNK